MSKRQTAPPDHLHDCTMNQCCLFQRDRRSTDRARLLLINGRLGTCVLRGISERGSHIRYTYAPKLCCSSWCSSWVSGVCAVTRQVLIQSLQRQLKVRSKQRLTACLVHRCGSTILPFSCVFCRTDKTVCSAPCALANPVLLLASGVVNQLVWYLCRRR
jgi:hypothetical protein